LGKVERWSETRKWISGSFVRDERVKKNQDPKANQRAADQKKRYEGKRMRPQQRQRLHGQPRNDEHPGPTDAAFDGSGSHGRAAVGFQNVASPRSPTLWTMSWQSLEVHES
jgi:hypothetical protein